VARGRERQILQKDAKDTKGKAAKAGIKQKEAKEAKRETKSEVGGRKSEIFGFVWSSGVVEFGRAVRRGGGGRRIFIEGRDGGDR
jgi:hypothetical protein